MPEHPITLEGLAAAREQLRTAPPTATQTDGPVTLDTLAGVRNRLRADREAGKNPLQPLPEGFGPILAGRLLGTDVDDPVPLARGTSTALGSIAGAVAGSKLKGPAAIPASLLLAAAGAGIGAAAPELAAEAAETLGILPKGFRDQNLLNDAELQHVVQAEVLLDLTLGGTIHTLTALGRPAVNFIAGTGREGRQLAEAAGKIGLEVPALVVGDGKAAKFFVAVFGRFPLIAPQIRKAGEKLQGQLLDKLDEVPARFGQLFSNTDIGVAIFKDASNLVTEVTKRFGNAYDTIFARAEALNVKVRPLDMLATADDVKATLRAQTPVETKIVNGVETQVRGSPGETLAKVIAFIDGEILSLRGRVPQVQRGTHGQPLSAEDIARGGPSGTVASLEEGGTAIADQSLRQMDGLISKIDQFIAGLDPASQKFARAQLLKISTAAKSDVTKHAIGDGAVEIATLLRNLDHEFSATMRTLFDTTAAKRFGSVKRTGIRGRDFDPNTKIPIDRIAKIVVDMQSPQAIEELSRIVTPETLSRIAARVLEDAIQKGVVVSRGGAQRINANVIRKELGLDAKVVNGRSTSSKRQAIDLLLKKATNGAMDTTVLDTILTTAQRLADTEIPNVNMFIARRGGIAGVRGIVRGMIPGIAFGAGGGAVGGPLGGVLGVLIFVGSGRAISSALADPLAARLLASVANQTVKKSVRKANAIRVTRLVATMMTEQEVIPDGLIDAITDSASQSYNQLFGTDNVPKTPRPQTGLK